VIIVIFVHGNNRMPRRMLKNQYRPSLYESGQTDAIFLNISKAFDTVPINRLCTKLNRIY